MRCLPILLTFCLALSLGAFSEEPEPDWAHWKSAQVSEALGSVERCWAVLVDPKTPYAVRMALAAQVDPATVRALLPKLVPARSLLERERSRHEWGFLPRPLDARQAYFPIRPENRQLLGHSWRVPDKQTPYPTTETERQAAPWPWQIDRALPVMLGRAFPHSESEARVWFQAVLKLPHATDQQALDFAYCCQASSHWKTPEVFQIWRKISLDPHFPLASENIAAMVGPACRLWDVPQSAALGARLSYELLLRAPTEEARRRTAYGLKDLRQRWDRNTSQERRLPASPACMLACLDLSQDPARGDEWTRLYCYGFSACEAMDDPPLQVDRRMDPHSPKVHQELVSLGRWLKQHRQALQTKAEAERAAWNHLAL